MSNLFIDDLVDKLETRKTINPFALAWLIISSFTLVFSFVKLNYGLRVDFNDAYKNGTILWKNGGLIFGVISAFLVVYSLSRPNTKPNIFMVSQFFVLFAIIIWRLIMVAIEEDFIHEMLNINYGGANVCIGIICICGLATFFIVHFYWLQNAASIKPNALGFFSGILSGLIAAAAYSFHCNMDGIFYILSCYVLPILSLGVFGAFWGGKKLQW